MWPSCICAEEFGFARVQIPRFFVVRVKWHKNKIVCFLINESVFGHLSIHWRVYGCKQLLTECAVLARSGDPLIRETIEAEIISWLDNRSVSATSVIVCSKWLNCLSKKSAWSAQKSGVFFDWFFFLFCYCCLQRRGKRNVWVLRQPTFLSFCVSSIIIFKEITVSAHSRLGQKNICLQEKRK